MRGSLEKPGFLRTEFSPELNHLQDSRDDLLKSLLASARCSWKVRDPDLGYPVAGSLCFDEDLCVDKTTDRLELHVVKDFPSVELEGAVDVFDLEVEQCSAQGIEDPRKCISICLVSSLDLVSRDNICFLDQREELLEFSDVELKVAICVEDKILCGGTESRAQCYPVSLIPWMMDDSYTFISARQVISNGPGAVSTTVVDNDDLVVVRYLV